MSDPTTSPASQEQPVSKTLWKTVWSAAKELAGSKKFQAAILSGVAWGVGKLGLHADATTLAPIVGPLWLYIFGQGLADFGKSAAQAK